MTPAQIDDPYVDWFRYEAKEKAPASCQGLGAAAARSATDMVMDAQRRHLAGQETHTDAPWLRVRVLRLMLRPGIELK